MNDLVLVDCGVHLGQGFLSTSTSYAHNLRFSQLAVSAGCMCLGGTLCITVSSLVPTVAANRMRAVAHQFRGVVAWTHRSKNYDPIQACHQVLCTTTCGESVSETVARRGYVLSIELTAKSKGSTPRHPTHEDNRSDCMHV